jgi:hypothetical protein
MPTVITDRVITGIDTGLALALGICFGSVVIPFGYFSVCLSSYLSLSLITCLSACLSARLFVPIEEIRVSLNPILSLRLTPNLILSLTLTLVTRTFALREVKQRTSKFAENRFTSIPRPIGMHKSCVRLNLCMRALALQRISIVVQ